MAKHEFGIIETYSSETEYLDYEPEKFGCISIDDEVMEALLPKLELMDTCFFSGKRLEKGLNYYGITLIPTESLAFFQSIVEGEENPAYKALLSKIAQALRQHKVMIHFGI